jgi:uncharacterized protein GlcG (DUF336 family)
MSIRLSLFLSVVSFCAFAQNQPSAPTIPSYGDAISLETAKKVLGAAETFAKGKQWPVAIAIVDTGGNLVLFAKLDNTQIGSIDVAMSKARTANNFKRPTKAFEEAVAGGGAGLRVLAVPGILPLEGGEPIYLNGKIVGGIGVSGMQSTQDAEVVKAGLAVLK